MAQQVTDRRMSTGEKAMIEVNAEEVFKDELANGKHDLKALLQQVRSAGYRSLQVYAY